MALLARDLMVHPVVTIEETATLHEAAKRMVEHRISSLVVTHGDGTVCGILTESDLAGRAGSLPFSGHVMASILGHYVSLEGLEQTYRQARTTKVSDIMAEHLTTVTPETPMEDVVDLMVQRGIKHVPVVEGGRATGILARHDLLRVLARSK